MLYVVMTVVFIRYYATYVRLKAWAVSVVLNEHSQNFEVMPIFDFECGERFKIDTYLGIQWIRRTNVHSPLLSVISNDLERS